MSEVVVNTEEKLGFEFFYKIKRNVNNNIWHRLTGEFLSAFALIFIINFGITLGEIGIPGFYLIYNVNFVIALWIGTFTFLAFLWMQKTTLSANFVNLVMSYRAKNINRKEFWISSVFQFVGGLTAAILVFFIVVFGINGGPGDKLYIMGGTNTQVKGLFVVHPFSDSGNYWASWDPTQFNLDMNNTTYAGGQPSHFKTSNIFFFAAVQGMVNGFLIIFSFMANNKIDAKYNKDYRAKWGRWIWLVVTISITTIISANTTNWVRLIAPAIVGQTYAEINGIDGVIILWTTLTFIAFQLLGLALVYVSVFFVEEIESIYRWDEYVDNQVKDYEKRGK